MRTRSTTALADDEPEVGVSSEPQAENLVAGSLEAGRATSGHPSNPAATGDENAQKATKTTKRRDRDAEALEELDTSSPAGSKQHTLRDAEKQGRKAKEPAGSRKLKRGRAVPQNQQRALEVGVRDLKSATLSHQTRATTGGEQGAVRDDDDEVPEDDDAPEEVESASKQHPPF